MADHKKKGDFDQWQQEDKGGNKKSGEKGDSNSRTPVRMRATAATSNVYQTEQVFRKGWAVRGKFHPLTYFATTWAFARCVTRKGGWVLWSMCYEKDSSYARRYSGRDHGRRGVGSDEHECRRRHGHPEPDRQP
jgi:hypothetical protein